MTSLEHRSRHPYRHRFPTDTSLSPEILAMIERMVSNLHTPIAEIDRRAREAREVIDQAIAREHELLTTFPSFSMEQLKKLKKQDLLVFRLSGRSIRNIYTADHFRLFNNQGESFLDDPSLQTQVAILRSPHTVNDYYHPTFHAYQRALHAWEKQITKEIPGVNVIIGSAADYIDLAHRHHSITFGEYSPWYSPAITSTQTTNSGLLTVAIPRRHQFTVDVSVTYPDWSQQNNVFMPLVLPTTVGWEGPDNI